MKLGWLIVSLLLVQSLVFAAIPDNVPNITNTTVSASSSFDEASTQFVYNYSVSSHPTNKGRIVGVSLDIKTDKNIHQTNPLPNHPEANALIKESVRKSGIRVVPVELERKMGWGHIPLTGNGYATWTATKAYSINPGNTSSVFKLTSRFPPGILKIQLRPSWFDYSLYPNREDTKEERNEFIAFRETLNKYVETLGPAAVGLGSYEHWNHLRDSLKQSIELGWVQDTTLASMLTSQLASAREALDASDGTLAKSQLQTLIDQVTNSADSQRRVEVRDLVSLNAQALINGTADTPIPFEPKLTLTPSVSKLPLGFLHTVTAKVVNVAYNDEPVSGVALLFRVTEGPNQGLGKRARTDANGEAVFSYIGKKVGTDKIIVKEPDQLLGKKTRTDTNREAVLSHIRKNVSNEKIVAKEQTQEPT
jgi:hypothetical protein